MVRREPGQEVAVSAGKRHHQSRALSHEPPGQGYGRREEGGKSSHGKLGGSARETPNSHEPTGQQGGAKGQLKGTPLGLPSPLPEHPPSFPGLTSSRGHG